VRSLRRSIRTAELTDLTVISCEVNEYEIVAELNQTADVSYLIAANSTTLNLCVHDAYQSR